MPDDLRWLARVLAVGILGTWPSARYLPFIDWLDHLGPAPIYNQVLWSWCALGFVLLFATRWARSGCACIGLSLLTGLLGCRPDLSVAHTYTGCLFLQLALSDNSDLIRWQMVVLYASAAFNKVFDPHWLSGDYFEAYLGQRHHLDWYLRASASLPPKLLGQVFGLASIATQLVLAGLFAAQLPVWGAALGTMFHSVIGTIVGTTFGPFYIALVGSYLAVLPRKPALPLLFVLALVWNPSVIPNATQQWLFLPFALGFVLYLRPWSHALPNAPEEWEPSTLVPG